MISLAIMFILFIVFVIPVMSLGAYIIWTVLKGIVTVIWALLTGFNKPKYY